MKKQEIYISTDVESDGPCPGLNNMLSLGAAVTDPETEEVISSWYGTFELLPDCSPHPDTMENFWEKPENQKAWEAARKNPRDPKILMEEFVIWVESFGGRPVFVNYPLAYDWKWIDYYLHRFIGRNPFGFSAALDIKSIVYGGRFCKSTTFKGVSKRYMPKRWFKNLPPHTHIADEDAIEQSVLFHRIRKEIDSK